MEKSIVYVSMKEENGLDCNYAIVDKGEKSVIIICKNTDCAIYDYDNLKRDDFDYKYLLLKHYDNETAAYKDFLKLVGKMCKKNIASKYFRNHIDEDNRIVFEDDTHEHAILRSEEKDFAERLSNLNSFIESNKPKLVS